MQLGVFTEHGVMMNAAPILIGDEKDLPNGVGTYSTIVKLTIKIYILFKIFSFDYIKSHFHLCYNKIYFLLFILNLLIKCSSSESLRKDRGMSK
jgi:hypothetical protein